MNKTAIIELEELIFQIKKKPANAARMMADIMGVLIGLKPAMMGTFDFDELYKFSYDHLATCLEKPGLKALFFKQSNLGTDKLEWIESIYISKDLKIAGQIHQEFEKLWQTMDDFGRVFALDEWKSTTIKIGKLLGYPQTAVEDFVDFSTNDEDVSYGERIRRVERNRYYAHSAKYEEQEYQEYDYKLNQAIAEFAPRTTQVLTSNQAKRWL